MIINLTQHSATPEQIAVGVVDVADRAKLWRLLTIQVGGENGFAALSEESQWTWMSNTAHEIIQAFVLPVVAQVTREHFAAMAECAPMDWDDTRALNERIMPTVTAMVGGFPPLMVALVAMLRDNGCNPVVALSERVSQDETQPDGSVRKVNVFVHCGFAAA